MDRQLVKGSNFRKRAVWVSGISFVTICLIYLSFTSGDSVLNVDAKRLHIQTVISGPFVEYIPLNGIVQPIKSMYIETVEGGKVEEIYIDDGNEIVQGTAIIRLANQQFQMDMITREAQLLDQQNNLRNARLQMDQTSNTLRSEALQIDYDCSDAKLMYEVNMVLFADSAISRIDFDRSRERLLLLQKSKMLVRDKLRMDSIYRSQQYAQLENSLQLVAKNLNLLESAVSSLIVRAPASGVLSQIGVELGETVSTGARIAQIDDMADLKVTTQVAEQYSSRVYIGQTATFESQGEVYDLVISKVYPEIINGHFNVDFVFAEGRPVNIRRGQSLQMKLSLGIDSEAIQVPRGAFFQHTGGHWIYVLTSDMEATKRNITLGKQNSDFYEVIDGLQSGDRVITSGYDMFRDADVLTIQSGE